MPSSIIIPAQFMAPWSGNSDGYAESATLIEDVSSEPQRMAVRYSGTTKQAFSFAWLLPPGITTPGTGTLVWVPQATGSVIWEHRGAYHPTPWLVSHGTTFSLVNSATGSIVPQKVYMTTWNPLNLSGTLIPMDAVAIELGRNATSDTSTGYVDLLYATWEFEDTPGSRNGYFWIPMNGVFVSEGTVPIAYYNQNGLWYRDFESTDSSIDFQITAPTDLLEATTLYVKFSSLITEPSGASGYWEVYTSITNPCMDYDQDFEYAGSGSFRNENGTGTPTYWKAITLNSDIQPGDQVTFRLKRLGDDGRDTFSGTQRVLGCYLRYERSSSTQSTVLSLTNAKGTALSQVVETVDEQSHYWTGEYEPFVSSYLDLPAHFISSKYEGSSVIKIRWFTRDTENGRVRWKARIYNASNSEYLVVGDEVSKTALVRGDYTIHETSLVMSSFTPDTRDTYFIRLYRDGDNIEDTFSGTVEVLNVLLDYKVFIN